MPSSPAPDVVEAALARLDLDTKAGLLAGQDMWSLPAVPAIGLRSLVMSDGPVGVRGTRWSPEDPSVALPSPTALAATWDPGLAHRAGQLLAAEARRKGVHMLLAPTINLHRTPLGGRHFECLSEDPVLTGRMATGYVRGVQGGGVAVAVKHFVANDSETERFSLDVQVDERTLRELYLAPFEHVVTQGGVWAVMSSYNGVNGSSMTENHQLQREVLRGEWGFDGITLSDWGAARDTARAITAGLDVAMPGPKTVYGQALATAVRDGRVPEEAVDEAVRRVLRLALRVGALDGAEVSRRQGKGSPATHGGDLAREIARRSFVLLKNDDAVLPLRQPDGLRRIAIIGDAAKDARVMGGGTATVFPPHVVTPLAGLRAALPREVEIVHAQGADPRAHLAPALHGFTLRAQFHDGEGTVLADLPQPDGKVQMFGSMPTGVNSDRLRSARISGTFTPDRTGEHTFAVSGHGRLRFTLGGRVLYDAHLAPESDDPFLAVMSPSEERLTVHLEAGRTVDVTLDHVPTGRDVGEGIPALSFGLGHRPPTRPDEELLREAVEAAARADVAVVVVATTEEVESEGFDRTDLKLPGRQDELVARVAAVNPRTVVVVNTGSPVEMPWRDDVSAILLTWFPGQEAGHALADVLLGEAEPGGRLPTTWPAEAEDCPVLDVRPTGGVLRYEEQLLIGYAAWQRGRTEPAYWFGHGLGYTEWAYEKAEFTPGTPGSDVLGTLRVRVRNVGSRTGREVVQTYIESMEAEASTSSPTPLRRLTGFATAQAEPGQSASVEITVPRRAVEAWDTATGTWRTVTGEHWLRTGRSCVDLRLDTPITVLSS
ncbi:glycoside hydrolase family 3 C-terminal domain-containing protein [Streptomyces sp. HM190]|uniref:glycoside hydrolase family 3 C-terminal domain-containing protein n=1 Tax=Streptomyces sp. HM190 TaxID=2695266 RepID=UPI00135A9043|nr:glycoside hydrolase family 3 C-terminal domain-containing protein [Streptomyces sp. HM190]